MTAPTNSGSADAAAASTTIPSATRDLADTQWPPRCPDYVADWGDHRPALADDQAGHPAAQARLELTHTGNARLRRNLTGFRFSGMGCRFGGPDAVVRDGWASDPLCAQGHVVVRDLGRALQDGAE